MTTTCGACTHENRPGSFFCSQCGTRLHFAAPPPGRLVRMNGSQQDRRLDLTGPVCVLGRGPDAGLRLEEESVSKEHACIAVEDGAFFLEDLGSSNGTFVNGRRTHGRVELRPGDLIRIGAVILKLEV